MWYDIFSRNKVVRAPGAERLVLRPAFVCYALTSTLVPGMLGRIEQFSALLREKDSNAQTSKYYSGNQRV